MESKEIPKRETKNINAEKTIIPPNPNNGLLKPGELPLAGDDWRYMSAIVGFEQKNKWPLLDKAYRAGLERWSTSRELLMGYGNNLYMQGQLAEALQQYKKVISHDPEFAAAYNNAAQVYAESFAQKAITLGGVHIQQYRSTLKDIRRMQKKNYSE